MAGSRQAAKEATRVKILAAASALFASGGYETATIRGIARAAGMSTGAVFANFKDKAELYAEIHGHPPITPETGRALLRALSFAQSVIKSGEPWTDDCQREIAGALATAKAA